jgi:DNA-binding response OmpR family regulator
MASVLLTDDNPDIRQFVEFALTRAGHVVTAAPDGKAALKLLETQQFDVVVTDIVMPDIDGLELIRIIRKNNPGVKVIGMSGGGRGAAVDYLEMAMRFGAAATLQKPFRPDELTAAVEAVLR